MSWFDRLASGTSSVQGSVCFGEFLNTGDGMACVKRWQRTGHEKWNARADGVCVMLRMPDSSCL